MFAKTVRWAFILLIAISFLFPQNTIGQVEPPTEDLKGDLFGDSPALKVDLDPTYTGWWVELVGQTGGSFFSVDAVGTLAYATYGQRLAVLDVSTPATPRLLGKTGVMTGESLGVAVQGNYAFLASPGIWTGSIWSGGAMRVVDVSDPTAPDEKVYFSAGDDRAPFDIALYGDHAFLAAESSLWVVDINDPLNPVSLLHLPIPDISPRNITIAPHPSDGKIYAYLAGYATSGGGKLKIVDITNPLSPSIVGTYTAPDDILDVSIQGSYAYVETETSLKVVSISTPALPVEVGSLTDPSWVGNWNINARGDYVYLTGLQEIFTETDLFYLNMLVVISVADPSQPALVASLELLNSLDIEYDVDLIVVGDMALLLLPMGKEGLRLVNVSVPASPVEVGYYNQEGFVDDVVRQGDYAYTTGTGFRILEYLTPKTTRQIGYYPTTGKIDSVVDNHAFLLVPRDRQNDLPSKLQLLDISNPAAPAPEGSFDTVNIKDVDVLGNFAYVADGSAGLRIIDISDTMNLVETGQITFTYDLDSYPKAVAVAPSFTQPGKIFAYVGAGEAGLRIVDVTDPGNPVEAGFFEPAWSFDAYLTAVYRPTPEAWGDIVPGDYVLIASDEIDHSDIYLFDVSDPVNPLIVSDKYIPRTAKDMVISGDYAYLAAGFRTLEILWLPVIDNAGRYLLPTEGFGVSVDGDYVSIAAGYSGLWDVWFGPGLSTLIEPSGGVYTSTFDTTTYFFPTGVFTDTAGFIHRPRYPGNMPHTPGLAGVDRYFQVWAYYEYVNEEIVPGQPYTVTIQFDEAHLNGFDENSLDLYYWDGSTWINEPGGVLDAAQNTFTAQLDHFSLWGLLAESKDIFLPMLYR